jgi:hypothetical protein
MTEHQKLSDRQGDQSKGGKTGTQLDTADVSDISCRCKEVSKKTIPEMLRLMLNDLAVWKKNKYRK